MKKEMVEKIESEITQKTKLPENIKEQTRKNIFTNIIIAIIAIAYLIFLILGSAGSTKNVRIIDFNMFSIIILGLAICLFEIAYKKDNGAIAMYGVEALIIALTTLLLPYVIFEVSEAHKKYYLMVSSYIGIYYIIKCIYISVKTKKKYLEEASDIKEIVKKENKRKSIKYEEEKAEDTQKNIEKVDKKENLKDEEKEQSEEVKKENKPTKTKKTNEDIKKIDKKEENNPPKRRGRPKKVEVKEAKQSTESIVSKSKTVKKKESIKKEIQEENKPKKRGRPKKQEISQEETKKEDQKNENAPKKRGRPRKVVTAND